MFYKNLLLPIEGLTIATGNPLPSVLTSSSLTAFEKTYVLGQSSKSLEIFREQKNSLELIRLTLE